MEKGTRVTITRGKEGVGKSGLVFWSGPSQYSEGTRLGVRTDDGESLWCTATDVVRAGRGAPAEDAAVATGGGGLSELPDFEFFCRHPDDWFEGANMGHLISIAFDEDIDADGERTIAEHLSKGELPFANVLFSARVMRFNTGGQGLTFLPKVESFARSLHADLPITDVVFHGIREGVTGYAHSPTPAADMGLQYGCPRPHCLDAPPWAKGSAFTEHFQGKNRLAREEAQLRQAREKLRKALARQKAGPVQVREERRPNVSAQDLPPSEFASAPPGEPRAGERLVSGPVRPVAQVHVSVSASTKLEVTDGGLRMEFELGWPVQRLSTFPDAKQVLVASSGFLSRVSLSSGEVTPLPSPNLHETFIGIAGLAEGYWSVLTGAALYVFDGMNTLVVRKKIHGTDLTMFAEGFGLGVWNGPQFTAFWFVNGKLKQLHKFDYAPAPMAEIEDALYFATCVGDLALVGAHAEIMRERGRTPRKSKPKSITCDFLRWLPAPDVHPMAGGSAPHRFLDDVVANDVVIDDVVADRTACSPSGKWAAFQNSGGLSVFDARAGKVSPALPECSDFFMNDEGRLVAIGFGQVMWRHPPAGEAKEWPGKRYSLPSRTGRASYLHDHDLLFFFPDDASHPPTPFACRSCIYPLWPLHGLRDAFEREGRAYLRWAGRTIEVQGLKELARRFEA